MKKPKKDVDPPEGNYFPEDFLMSTLLKELEERLRQPNGLDDLSRINKLIQRRMKYGNDYRGD